MIGKQHENWYVYKITYPNGKIYVGVDWGKLAIPWNYVGSSKNPQLKIDCDSYRENSQKWMIEQEILFESWTCSKKEILKIEHEMILKYQATSPEVGYNLRS
jgi:hypothetical protein